MWFGKIKKHSINEAASTTTTVNGISAIKSPNLPPTATSPKKAMIVVVVAANTGRAIRRAAVSAASIGPSPLRARLSACSPTTMASSTTIPKVMIKANNEIMLMVMPAAYMIASAASIAVGIPAATQKAVRAFKNRNSKISTSPRPLSPFSSSMFRRPEIYSARVLINSIWAPSGKVSDNRSAIRWTVS